LLIDERAKVVEYLGQFVDTRFDFPNFGFAFLYQ
jgi:hypothetical protein